MKEELERLKNPNNANAPTEEKEYVTGRGIFSTRSPCYRQNSTRNVIFGASTFVVALDLGIYFTFF